MIAEVWEMLAYLKLNRIFCEGLIKVFVGPNLHLESPEREAELHTLLHNPLEPRVSVLCHQLGGKVRCCCSRSCFIYSHVPAFMSSFSSLIHICAPRTSHGNLIPRGPARESFCLIRET